MSPLLNEKLRIINVGVSAFGEAARDAGATVLDLDWSPPAGGDRALGRRLAGLVADARVEEANARAFAAYLDARPVLVDIAPAGEAMASMGERTILHAGPPIAWERMCGPMQGAVLGAIVFEGWAADLEGAWRAVDAGEIAFAPCHDHGAVGPMAGIISPSMPVFVVQNAASGKRAYSNLNEGLGKVLRFGANGAEVLERLRWMRDRLAPVLRTILRELDGIDLKRLIAQALHMGDEVHNRNAAATALFLKHIVPGALRCEPAPADLAAAIEFMATNDHFFLNISMAACKAMMDAAAGVAHSSMVTAMARNGTEFGIRMSGAGERWFTWPAPVVDGLFFPGYSAADAAPDLGDSAITETAGLGAFAMAAAPAIVQFIGGTPSDALASTLEMGHITLRANDAFTLPALDFAGTPAGIDVRAVVDCGIAPIINTGIAHRTAGIGQIGAGITRAPMGCFARAVAALADGLPAANFGD